ncbi:MAG: hypothetical protein IKK26_06905 [Clostridia bacterium]|nr:hypothetical protein [Clostridia bacterium]
MKENELRKLTRKQLLELLLTQTERADELEKKLKKAEEMLQNRQLTEMQAGNIAEASIRLNNVFEAAQAAADQYLENVITQSANIEEKAAAIEAEAKKKAKDMLAEAEIKCYEREKRSEARLKEIEEKITKLRALCSEFNSMFTNVSTTERKTKK